MSTITIDLSQISYVRYIITPCSLGVLLLGLNDKHELCAMFLGEHSKSVLNQLFTIYPESICHLDERLQEWAKPFSTAVDTGEWPDVPIASYCLPFQERVWNALRLIKAGDPLTYNALGHRVGQPNTRRRAAATLAANRLAALVACDHVFAKDLGHADYRWLLESSHIEPKDEPD